MPYPPAPDAAACVLAFDTATEEMALALHADGQGHGRVVPGGAAASAALVPGLRALLAEAGRDWTHVDAIAWGRGPGAFTGLRTACAVAQGLGFGLQRPLWAIDSLMIVAEDARVQLPAHADDPLRVAVAMDARMDEAYAAVYGWTGARWQVLQAPALLPVAALAQRWQSLDVHAVAGSAVAAFGPRLPLPPGATAVGAAHDRAAALLRLALRAVADLSGVPAEQAQPLYLRDKVAQTTAEREAARAAAAT